MSSLTVWLFLLISSCSNYNVALLQLRTWQPRRQLKNDSCLNLYLEQRTWYGPLKVAHIWLIKHKKARIKKLLVIQCTCYGVSKIQCVKPSQPLQGRSTASSRLWISSCHWSCRPFLYWHTSTPAVNDTSWTRRLPACCWEELLPAQK